MSIKLLPASVNSIDPSQAPDVSIGLVPLTQRAITTQAGQISLVPSADTFSWSSATSLERAKWIDGTPVEDSQSDETSSPAGEYVSGWAWSGPVESTAIATYRFYAAAAAGWSGQLIDVYA
jgi:hypothetical protein